MTKFVIVQLEYNDARMSGQSAEKYIRGAMQYLPVFTITDITHSQVKLTPIDVVSLKQDILKRFENNC